ncbi:hypothetical protein C0J52_27520 [Blattella germanica]|nr:hypothetical protein C0J52_27520 [Blattella germanica]
MLAIDINNLVLEKKNLDEDTWHFVVKVGLVKAAVCVNGLWYVDIAKFSCYLEYVFNFIV